MATIKGGEKLELALAKIAAQLAKPGTLRVGFLEGATYPGGTPVALIAAIHNYGAPRAGIPSRPFFSNLVADKQKEWGPAIAKLLKPNDYDVERVLDLTGQAIQKQLRQSIIDTNSPPLAASTLRKRGVDPNMKYNPKDPKTFGAKPLIHTAVMINAVDFEIDSK